MIIWLLQQRIKVLIKSKTLKHKMNCLVYSNQVTIKDCDETKNLKATNELKSATKNIIAFFNKNKFAFAKQNYKEGIEF